MKEQRCKMVCPLGPCSPGTAGTSPPLGRVDPATADVPRRQGDRDMLLGGGQAPGVLVGLPAVSTVVTQTLSRK